MNSGVVILTQEQFTLLESKIETILRSIQPQTASSSKEWLTSKESIRLLGVGQTTLWNYRNQGKLKARKIGRKLYFSAREVNQLIENS